MRDSPNTSYSSFQSVLFTIISVVGYARTDPHRMSYYSTVRRVRYGTTGTNKNKIFGGGSCFSKFVRAFSLPMKK